MKRNEVIQFRVTPTEKAFIEGQAIQRGVSASGFIRSQVFWNDDSSPAVIFEDPTLAAQKAQVRRAVAEDKPYSVKVVAATHFHPS